MLFQIRIRIRTFLSFSFILSYTSSRVANPVGFNRIRPSRKTPDPILEKKPNLIHEKNADPNPTFEKKKTDPDLTFKITLDPNPNNEKKTYPDPT